MDTSALAAGPIEPDMTHVPVLVDRCVQLLAPALGADGAVLVDATLGMGGHTLAILQAIPTVRIIGLDRDEDALDYAQQRLAAYADRVTCVHAVYDEMAEVCVDLDVPHVSGILFDLGVSSMQLDEAERGFSYSHDAPLDMRMDQNVGMTAADIVNTYDQRDLARVLREYGEEPFATRICARIAARRDIKPFARTGELADIIREAIPAPARRTGGNPAKRTFQALRIEVNGELDALSRALPQALDLLDIGGRLVVMAYQSLEDRLVKRTLAAATTSAAPVRLPIKQDESQPSFQLLTHGAEKPGEAELVRNPRSASVRLRAAERVKPGGVPTMGKDRKGYAVRDHRRSTDHTRATRPGRISSEREQGGTA